METTQNAAERAERSAITCDVKSNINELEDLLASLKDIVSKIQNFEIRVDRLVMRPDLP